MMQIGDRKVTKIITGGKVIWEKPTWHELKLLDEQVTGQARFMILDKMILFDGKITFNKVSVAIPLFKLPESVLNPTFIEGDEIYLAETKNDNNSLPTAIFLLKMDGSQVLGYLNSAQSGMRTLNLYHVRMKISES